MRASITGRVARRRPAEGCEPRRHRQHNALVHDELSERIISATPVSGGGGCRSAALNKGERVGGRQRKEEEHRQAEKKEEAKVFIRPGGFFFCRAPMLEHSSSELALVQSLYANNMRCPPPAPGISVRSEDLPLRYVSLAPQTRRPRPFVGRSGLGLCLG